MISAFAILVRRISVRGAAAVLACVLSAGVGLAAPSITLQTSSSQPRVGEPLLVQVEISDFEEAAPPEWPAVDGATVSQVGGASDSRFLSIVNGRRTETRSRTYTYEVTVDREGALTLGPVSARVDGDVISSRAVTLRVLPSDRDRYFDAEVTLDAERIYVGQRVTATLTVWCKPPVMNNRRLNANAVYNSVLNNSPSFGPFPREVANAENVSRRRGVDDGAATWFAFDFVTQLVFDRPGAVNFDAVTVGVEHTLPSGKRVFRMHPRTPPIEVLELPAEGRPANFTGAVGLFSIETGADPVDVRVGDPIRLTIDVFGDGSLSTLPPPALDADASLIEKFRIPNEPLAGEVREGRRRFTLLIRAKRDDISEIPPIEYPYYDPDAERYVVARSKPIPLRVAPAAALEAPDLSRLAGDEGGKTDAAEALDGLRGIEVNEARLLAASRGPRGAVLVGVMTAPPAALLMFWVGRLALQSRIGSAASRRLAASRRAGQRIAAAASASPRDAAATIAAALAQYLSDRSGLPAQRLLGEGAVAVLRDRGAPDAVVDEWIAAMRACDEVAFAGGADVESQRLSSMALAVVARLNRETL